MKFGKRTAEKMQIQDGAGGGRIVFAAVWAKAAAGW